MSHRDRADLGTHLSLGENRVRYFGEADLHLSLRPYAPATAGSTLLLRGWFVNELAKRSRRGEVELARDLDAPLDRARDRTVVGVEPKHPLYRVPILLIGGEVEDLPDPLYDEDLALRLHLPDGVGVEILEGDLARCQRAPEGAEQSTASCCDEIIKSGIDGFHLFRRDAVVLSDLAVDAEQHGLVLDGEIGAPDPALHGLYPHPRDVRCIGHEISFPLFVR